MTASTNMPAPRRRRVAALLRQLREQAGISREAAADRINMQVNGLYRIEAAIRGIKGPAARVLLDFYGVKGAEQDAIVELVLAANRPGWWADLAKALPQGFGDYVALEAEATRIRSFDISVLSGLLQTASYARALRDAILPLPPQGETEMWLRLREGRQRRLLAPAGGDTLSVWAIVDEALLQRPVGGAATMAAQLDHLVTLAESGRLTIQVLAAASGAHPAMVSAFSVLDFEAGGSVIYCETLTSAVYVDDERAVHESGAVFDNLTARAQAPDKSLDVIRGYVADLKAGL